MEIGLEMVGEEAEVGDVAVHRSGSLVHELDKLTKVIEGLLERIFWVVFFASAQRAPRESEGYAPALPR